MKLSVNSHGIIECDGKEIHLTKDDLKYSTFEALFRAKTGYPAPAIGTDVIVDNMRVCIGGYFAELTGEDYNPENPERVKIVNEVARERFNSEYGYYPEDAPAGNEQEISKLQDSITALEEKSHKTKLGLVSVAAFLFGLSS